MRRPLTGLIAVLGIIAASCFHSAAADAKDPPQKTVRVAGIVLKWIRGDKAANYRRAEPMIREAAASGARIVCTTECFLDGYAISDKSIPLAKYRALGETIPDGPYFQKLSRLAADLHVYLIVGMLEADGDDRFNTAAMIGTDGKLIGRYHKQRLGHETVRNTAGKVSSVFETEFGKTPHSMSLFSAVRSSLDTILDREERPERHLSPRSKIISKLAATRKLCPVKISLVYFPSAVTI